MVFYLSILHECSKWPSGFALVLFRFDVLVWFSDFGASGGRFFLFNLAGVASTRGFLPSAEVSYRPVLQCSRA